MANTPAFEYPVVGATPPTAAQANNVDTISAIVTGDGAATTFTITHNWGMSAAELAGNNPSNPAGGGPGPFPLVEYEELLAAGYTAAPLVANAGKTTNAVAFTCTAFTGAGLRVRLRRPTSLEK